VTLPTSLAAAAAAAGTAAAVSRRRSSPVAAARASANERGGRHGLEQGLAVDGLQQALVHCRSPGTEREVVVEVMGANEADDTVLLRVRCRRASQVRRRASYTPDVAAVLCVRASQVMRPHPTL
jgi:hypothetical protein